MKKSLVFVLVIISTIVYNLVNISVEATHHSRCACYNDNLKKSEETKYEYNELVDIVAKLFSCLFCKRDEPTLELVITILYKLPQTIHGLFGNKAPSELVNVLKKSISQLVDGLLEKNERLLEDLIKAVLKAIVQVFIKLQDNGNESLANVAELHKTLHSEFLRFIFYTIIDQCK